MSQSSVTSKTGKRERLHEGLILDFRSKKITRLEEAESKCLIRLHNCTSHRVTPFWIDCSGVPINYPTLPRGASLNIDTFASHLWYFTSANSSSTKILVVPEESLKIFSASTSGTLISCFTPKKQNIVAGSLPKDRRVFQDELLGLNNVLICSLCRFVLKQYSRAPTKIPCQHFTGESKFSISDLDHKSWAECSSIGAYIYTCSENVHCKSHSQQRRNLYLVEMFPNLRERCFLTLKDRVSQEDVTDLDLPFSLQQEYVQFISTLKKLNENNKLI